MRGRTSWINGRCPGLASVVITTALVALSGAAPAIASSLPQPTAGGDRLTSVSCVTAQDCWAVGSSQASGSNDVTGELLHWTGTTWLAVPSPAAANALNSVSCTSSQSCWAVGDSTGGAAAPTPLLIHWDGTTWTRVAAPRIREAYFRAVSCQSARSCWVVGVWARDRTLAVHFNGTRWQQTPTPNPSRFSRALTTVTCRSASDCWASGYYYGPPVKPTVTAYALILHWDGAVWRKAWTSGPYYGGESSQSVALDGLACPRGGCLAVGTQVESLFYPVPLAARLTGQRWKLVAAAPVRYSALNAISCTSLRSCLAVGQVGQLELGPAPRGFSERWNGVRWTRVRVPSGLDALAGVSCVSASDCWAVGNSRAGNVALRWDGRTWSAF